MVQVFVVIDTPKINNALTCDFEHFLPRKSVLYIDTVGAFKIVDGVPEDPVEFQQLDNGYETYSIRYSCSIHLHQMI